MPDISPGAARPRPASRQTARHTRRAAITFRPCHPAVLPRAPRRPGAGPAAGPADPGRRPAGRAGAARHAGGRPGRRRRRGEHRQRQRPARAVAITSMSPPYATAGREDDRPGHRDQHLRGQPQRPDGPAPSSATPFTVRDQLQTVRGRHGTRRGVPSPGSDEAPRHARARRTATGRPCCRSTRCMTVFGVYPLAAQVTDTAGICRAPAGLSCRTGRRPGSSTRRATTSPGSGR